MSRLFALVENGIVADVIVAEAWPEGVDVTELTPRPGPGWSYDGQAFAPSAEVPAPATPLMTRYAFLSRIPLEVHIAIEEAMPTIALLRVAMTRLNAAAEINVEHPEVHQLVSALAQMDFLTEEQMEALLALKPLNERGSIHPETFEVTP